MSEKTIWEVIEDLKTIGVKNNITQEPAENSEAKDSVPSCDEDGFSKVKALEAQLAHLVEKNHELQKETEILQEKLSDAKAAQTKADGAGCASDDGKQKAMDKYMESTGKHMEEMAAELRETKAYSARLYDKVEELRKTLLVKQHAIDSARELIKPLLDPDSGASRHDVAEHILSVLDEGSSVTPEI